MPIEKSHIMMFARSIGDPNPIYYDEDHANDSDVGSIIAPPTFTQASAQFDPDYFLRPKIDGKGPYHLSLVLKSNQDQTVHLLV